MVSMAKHVNDVPAVNLGRPPFDLSPSTGLEIGKGALAVRRASLHGVHACSACRTRLGRHVQPEGRRARRVASLVGGRAGEAGWEGLRRGAGVSIASSAVLRIRSEKKSRVVHCSLKDGITQAVYGISTDSLSNSRFPSVFDIVIAVLPPPGRRPGGRPRRAAARRSAGRAARGPACRDARQHPVSR
jgi:hypothetical protein